MFKTIVVATDGSEQSITAVETAADIAEKYSAALIIVSVVEPGPMPRQVREKLKAQHKHEGGPSHPLIANVPSWMDTAIETVQRSTGQGHALMETITNEALSNARSRASSITNAEIETVIEYGDPAETILDLAHGRDAELIVTGRRGLGGLRGLMLGSVSSKISQLFDRSCLMVGHASY